MPLSNHDTSPRQPVDICYFGCSVALALASETFLLARASSSLGMLLALVGTQVALCLALGAVERRRSFLDLVSPTWVCVLFVLGVGWSILAPLATGLAVHALAVAIPAAALFGLGNALNAYHLFDFCLHMPAREFSHVAVGGAGLGAALNYVISYLLPDAACALCGVLAVGWYALSRHVSRETAGAARAASPVGAAWRDEAPGEPGTPRARTRRALVPVTLALLGLSCGILPAAVFEQDNGLTAGLAAPFAFAILTVSAALFCWAAWGRRDVAVSGLAPGVGLAAATGLAVLPVRCGFLIVCASAVALVSQLLVACVGVYLCAHYVGDPKVRPARFWGVQVLALLSTSAGTAAIIALRNAAGGMELLVPCLAGTYFLLAFLVLLQRVWCDPAEETGAEASSVQAAVPGADGDAGAAPADRCRALAVKRGLTRRESDVLGLVAAGWTVDMVAKRLVVSPGTVRTHLKHIYTKLDVHSKSELLELVGVGRQG